MYSIIQEGAAVGAIAVINPPITGWFDLV